MQFGHSVILKLHNDDGLLGWTCHVYREARNEKKKIKFRQDNGNTLVFQTSNLEVPETIFWCTDQAEQSRSNQIVLRASGRLTVIRAKDIHIYVLYNLFCHLNFIGKKNSPSVIQLHLLLSDKPVSLEMYPQPAVLGESLTLRCLVWGTDQITEAIFSKDGTVIEHGIQSTYMISKVTESTKGKYQCNATYTYKGHTHGPPYRKESEVQEVLVQGM